MSKRRTWYKQYGLVLLLHIYIHIYIQVWTEDSKSGRKDIVHFMQQYVDIAYACCSIWSCFLCIQESRFSLSVVALMCSVIRRHTPHFENLFLCGKCTKIYKEIPKQDLITYYEKKKQSPSPCIASKLAPSFCLLYISVYGLSQVKPTTAAFQTV